MKLEAPAFITRRAIAGIEPYIAGKPVAEVTRELGLTNVVKLASNENPLGPSPLAVSAMCAAAGKVNLYPESTAPDLRAALATFWGLAPHQIIVGNGSDEVFRLLAEAYLEPGDRVIVASPTFSVYRLAAQIMAATVIEVPVIEGAMDLEGMARATQAGPRDRHARIVFVCSPNNPTGASILPADFRSFLKRVPTDCIIVLDQAYQEYAQDDMDFRQFLGLHPGLIVTRTFSKIYGLAGLRLGYAVAADPHVLSPLWTVKDPFAVNIMAQVAGVAALADHAHVQRSLAVNEAGKTQLITGLRALGLDPMPSRANFVLVDLGQPAASVYQALLQRGIIVRPCASFGLPNCIRVSVGLEDQNELFLRSMSQCRCLTSTQL